MSFPPYLFVCLIPVNIYNKDVTSLITLIQPYKIDFDTVLKIA